MVLMCIGLGVMRVASATAHGAGVIAAGVANPVVTENAQPGTPGWDQSATASSSDIDGYTSEVSVTPGSPIHLHITGAAGVRYRVEVYRLGFYQGVGARLQQCVPSCTSDEAVAARPPTPAPDPSTGFLDAAWPVTDTVTLAGGSVSGLYLAKVVVTAGGAKVGEARNITFVVREASPQSAILVQIGVNTDEAYNNWGGKSLYTSNSTGGVAAVEVSFNRPDSTVNWEMQWDYQLIRFLERNGYDASYATDVDTAQGVDAPGARRLLIVAGHSEYWSKEIRDALDNAQASGTNMAFMGANTGYWQMRYANNYRAILEYRSASADPAPTLATKTTRFQSLSPPRPECLLEGVQDLVGLHDGYAPPPSNRNYQVVAGALGNPWFSGSGLTASTVLTGLVGYEWDTANQPGCPPTQVLFTWTGLNTYGQSSEADAATFTAPSGARVFAAGSFQYSWGLDGYGHPTTPVEPQLQTFTQNMLNDLSSGSVPPPNPAPPSISGFSPTAGTPGTSVTISGSNLTGASAVMFNGTAASFIVTSSNSINATVPSGATSGPIVVTTAAGSMQSTNTFAVTVTPDFSLSVSPGSQTVRRGGRASYAVTITPTNGFSSSSVHLSVGGLPRRTTASFSPNPPSTTSTLTVSTNSMTARGTYTLTVTGTSGSLKHTYKISVTVQ